MAAPQDPSAKETPREGGGEDEAGKSVEKKGEREGAEGGPGGSRWLLGGGRQRSSSSSCRGDYLLPFWSFSNAYFLYDTLLNLSGNKLRRFGRQLRAIPLEEGFVRIPEEELQEASAFHLRDLLLSYYGETYAFEVAAEALRAIDCDSEADWLLRFFRDPSYSSYMEMPPDMQKNVRKKKMWTLKGVPITGVEIVCKGRKELLEIIEKDLEFFLRRSYFGLIITSKENWKFQKADSNEKSEKLLDMIQERGEATCCWFLEQVETKYPGSIEILLPIVAVQGSVKKLDQASYNPVVQPESPLFAEKGKSKMENSAAGVEESVVCHLCPSEDLPETIRPEVFLDSETSCERYRLCFTEAGSFLCLNTDVIFEVRGAVTITYHFDSWSKHLAGQNMENWVVAGPLINIEADPAEAVAAVHFPHFLCLADQDGSQVYIAHFVEGGMILEEPDRMGSYHIVLENPNFSPHGAILKKSWFKRKILVHTVALLYQMVQFQPPTFHLYLLPNDASLRKAVHEHEEQCPSQRIEKPPWTRKPLAIGCCFFVETNDARICPKEVEFQYLDADKLQQYVELSAEQMQDMFNFKVMEKRKNKLIWEAHVMQKDLKSSEMASSALHSEQDTSYCTSVSSTDLGHGVERRAMKKTIRDHLVSALENLREGDLNRFKCKLNEFPIAENFDNIPQGPLEKANAIELSQLLLRFYTEDYAVQVTADVLKAINCRDEAEKLLSLTRKK